MNIPIWLLKLLPMFDYICPKCRKEVKKNSHECIHCKEKYPFPLKIPPAYIKDKDKLESYVHKYIFPKVSSSMRKYLTKYFTTYFSDGFDTGDFTNWTGSTSGDSDSVSVVSTDPHTGTNHMQCSCNGNWEDIAYAYKTLPSSYSTLFTRCYVKFKTALPNTGMIEVLEHYATGSGGQALTQARITYDSGSVYWGMAYVGSSGWTGATSSQSVSLDTWYCLEIETYVASSGGISRVYVDGDLVSGLEDVYCINDGWGNITTINVGETWGTTTVSHSMYIDCVICSDTENGEEVVASLVRQGILIQII